MADRTEHDYRDLARELGVDQPRFAQAEQPDLFRAWADRVDQLSAYAKSGDAARLNALKTETSAYARRLEDTPGPRALDDASPAIPPAPAPDPGHASEHDPAPDANQRPSILNSKSLAATRDPHFVETRSLPEIQRDDLLESAERLEAAGQADVAANLRKRAEQIDLTEPDPDSAREPQERAAASAISPAEHIEQLRAELGHDHLPPQEREQIQRELDQAIAAQTAPHGGHPQETPDGPAAQAGQSAEAQPSVVETQKTAPPATLAEVAERLNSLWPEIAADNPRLDAAIERLADEASDPSAATRPGFRVELADALQDAERVAGPIEIEPSLRQELLELSTTASGLKNDSLDELLQFTPEISDQALVDDIRTLARSVAPRQTQDTPAIARQIDHIQSRLEQSVDPEPDSATLRLVEESLGLAPERSSTDPQDRLTRTAPNASTSDVADNSSSRATSQDHSELSPEDPTPPRRPDAGPSTQPAPLQSSPDAGEDPKARAARELAAFDPPSSAADKTTAANQLNRPGDRTAASPDSRPQAADASAAQTPRAEPGRQTRPAAARDAAPDPALDLSAETYEARSRRTITIPVPAPLGGLVERVLRQASDAARAQQQQSEPQPQQKQNTQANLSARYDQFEANRMTPKRLENQFQETQLDGKDALQALRSFNEGPGASILARIEKAAETNKDGIQGVLAEMRPGGAYEDLRKQFNAAYANNDAFAAAYDRAASALQRYGESRQAIIPALPKHPNAAKWAGEFEKLDAEIGEAASSTPGHFNESTALEHLAEKTREIIEKIIEKVKSAFRADAAPDSRPSPSPSPGP